MWVPRSILCVKTSPQLSQTENTKLTSIGIEIIIEISLRKSFYTLVEKRFRAK